VNVFGAEDIYYDLNKAGKNVVIIGGGLVGSELAIHLAQNGRNVTVLEMLPELNCGCNILHGQAVGIQIAGMGIKAAVGTKVLEITGKDVIAESKDGRKTFEADTVIYAIGQKPLLEEAKALSQCVPEFHMVGDCNVPANIRQAVYQAYYAVRDIGRV
jgi:pyruvate/2-oxoglutarate dehydrogenase complex dihydrolipoamide dehydrogenase (E3) component